jgi:hypothetical protein
MTFFFFFSPAKQLMRAAKQMPVSNYSLERTNGRTSERASETGYGSITKVIRDPWIALLLRYY